jgi:hypothetical protein
MDADRLLLSTFNDNARARAFRRAMQSLEVSLTLHEIERRRRQRRQSDPVLDREIELARAVDDLRVMTIPEWCKVAGFSVWTGKRLLAAGKGPKLTQISDRRVGITVGHHRQWLAGRVR